jgi:hypothetical protein
MPFAATKDGLSPPTGMDIECRQGLPAFGGAGGDQGISNDEV